MYPDDIIWVLNQDIPAAIVTPETSISRANDTFL